jgi:hypothetical protein
MKNLFDSTNFSLIQALHFLTPKEIRILTKTTKKLKKQISENKQLWIHFIESKYGSLNKCIHKKYYIPYILLAYFATNTSVLKFTPHINFESMTTSLKTEISDYGKLKFDKTEFDKIFSKSNQMLNQNHSGQNTMKRNTIPSMNCVKYFDMITEGDEREHFQFGFYVYSEKYIPMKKRSQISFNFQEQFLIQDIVENVFEFLDDKEILNVSMVCQFWNSITNESNFLLNRIEKKYGSLLNSMLERNVFEFAVRGTRSSELLFSVESLENSAFDAQNFIEDRLNEGMQLFDRNSGKPRIDRMLTICREKSLLDDDIYECGYLTISNFREGYHVPANFMNK